MRIRKALRVLHRDVGYFLTVLVCLYAVSGIAVNHIDSWNPSYSRTRTALDVGPLADAPADALEAELARRAGIEPSEVTGRHRAGADEFVVFLPNGGEARVALSTGRGEMVRSTTRTLIFESNVLHLNHLKGVWTYVADAFAVALLAMAVSGLFLIEGRKGLLGRGKWFVAAGAALPVAFLVHYYATR